MKCIKYFFSFVVVFLIATSSLGENIVFDLFGVLVHIPISEKIKNTGVTNPLGYVFSDQKDLMNLKTDLFAMLSRVNYPSPSTPPASAGSAQVTAQGVGMPSIMMAWQIGELNYRDALLSIEHHLSMSKDYAFYEKNLFRNASRLAFDLETRKQSYRLIEAGISLVQRVYAEVDEKGRRRHKLFILSNMDTEMMEHLESSYPSVFRLFDGTVISAEAKSLKPHKEIYQTLLTRYSLRPEETWVIDDQKENINGAIAQGMHGIECVSHKNVTLILERAKILTPVEGAYVHIKRFIAGAGVLSFVVGMTNL